MMDGRVKTLHPKIHGGILGRRGIDDAIMDEHGIKPIDLVAVNLYPFEATINKPGCDLPTAIENIDIGGPTMVRSAAKNHKDVSDRGERQRLRQCPRKPQSRWPDLRSAFRPGAQGLRAHRRL